MRASQPIQGALHYCQCWYSNGINHNWTAEERKSWSIAIERAQKIGCHRAARDFQLRLDPCPQVWRSTNG
jgi:hypothetical protein